MFSNNNPLNRQLFAIFNSNSCLYICSLYSIEKIHTMKKVFYLIPLCCLCGNLLSAKEYHVSPQESDANDGSVSAPLKTINVAAQKALPGDVVTVHGGTYREWVNPLSGGESNRHDP